MNVDWVRYKQIILNDRPVHYGPDKSVITQLSNLFPDMVVYGFGRYTQTDCWYIMAYSNGFPENYLGTSPIISISDIKRLGQTYLTLVK